MSARRRNDGDKSDEDAEKRKRWHLRAEAKVRATPKLSTYSVHSFKNDVCTYVLQYLRNASAPGSDLRTNLLAGSSAEVVGAAVGMRLICAVRRSGNKRSRSLFLRLLPVSYLER